MYRKCIQKANCKKRAALKGIFFIHFVICELVLLPFFAILLIYYGPFTNLRDTIVSTSMGTSSNKFFATWFLSQSEINQILGKSNSVVVNGTQDLNNLRGSKTAATGSNVSAQNKNAIQIIDISGSNFKGKLMVVPHPSKVVLKLAPKIGQIGAPLSEIVGTYHAIGGVNAGGFQDDSFLGTGAIPDGIAIEDGVLRFVQSDLNTFSVIGFDNNNILRISNNMTLDEIKSSSLRCAVSFGPALILNGKPLVTKGGTALQPRTAIGQRKDGTVLLLVIDGRQSDSKGANYMDVLNIMQKYGAENAANLDGGSSTTMNYQGKTINTPCDITGERSIASAFLVMP